MKRLLLFILLAISQTLSLNTFAVDTAPPRNQQVLGAATYVTMPLQKLAHPVLLWADRDFLLRHGVMPNLITDYFAYAAPSLGETGASYLPEFITAFIDGNGGIGMNDNFGSGRAAIIHEDWQIKGSGRTVMVNPKADLYHSNGAALMAEGIHEAVWSRLLAEELPYGAFRTVAVIATGSYLDTDLQPRALIVREDPLRPGHYVINPSAELLGDARDAARIKAAMEHLLAALPTPAGAIPIKKSDQFRVKTFEFIERQAIQHGYAWSRGLFHGGTSPSNAGLDGRMIDFGTFSAFDGYPKVRVIDEDGFFGDTSLYKRDLLKNIRDSWVRTLSPELLAGLPSEQEWFDRFETTFQRTRKTEMLRLAGAFSEFSSELFARSEGKKLAEILLKLAEAGNDKEIEAWKGESPWGTGTYNLGKILKAAAEVELQGLNVELPALKAALPQVKLRREFVEAYKKAFRTQRSFAAQKGIAATAESEYRRLASEIRNRKMTTLFRADTNEKPIWDLIAKFKKTGDPKPTQDYVDELVAENRREFRDAAPFTIVLRESKDRTERLVFDAQSGRTSKVRINREFIRGGTRCVDSLRR